MASIRKAIFAHCTSLTRITLPPSVTEILDYGFNYCTFLTTITLSSSLKWLGDYAFEECTSLTTITIPPSLASIGDFAFYGPFLSLVLTDYSERKSVEVDCNIRVDVDKLLFYCSVCISQTLQFNDRQYWIENAK